MHIDRHTIAKICADIFYVAMATQPMAITLPAQETLHFLM